LAESDWFVVGLFAGVLIGIPLGWILAQITLKPAPSSVLFDRDSEGKVSGIHYVPSGAKS
jgi:hypothetical protein